MKKIWLMCILCCLVSSTAYAKDVYYRKYTDANTGREIEYFDLDEEKTERLYFTQSYWLADSSGFVVSSMSESRMYAYDLASHTVKALHGTNIKCNDVGITKDNIMYMRNQSTASDPPVLYRLDLNTGSLRNLGSRPSGYQIHPTADGKFLTVMGDIGAEIVIYDVENNKWDVVSKAFDYEKEANHVMINPVYNNLVLFAHEGTAENVFDRMWIYDRIKGTFNNVFKQLDNISGVKTGEAVGHESWTADGESIVAVKYNKSTNIGKNGIIRMNKYGGEREYLNSDYNYWHTSASPDGRWIVADTEIESGSKSKIVLIDSKTGKSYLLAQPKVGEKDPWQPHAQFSRDGKKVTFSMIYRQKNNKDVLGVGIIDVSDIINDGQYVDPIDEKTNEKQGFLLTPLDIDFDACKVSTHIDNIDGFVKSLNLYTAVYDDKGILISVNMNKFRSSSDGIIECEFSWPINSKTLKCFIWDEECRPVCLAPSAVRKVRLIKTGATNATITWQASDNLVDDGYAIYRNGVKIDEITDLVYRDYNLDCNTEYLYEILPIYDKYIGDNCSYVSVTPVYNEGKWTISSNGANIHGPKASIKLKTRSDVLKSNLGAPITENGLNFVVSTDPYSDSFTTEATQSSPTEGTFSCRRLKNAGAFYFKTDNSILSADEKDVSITITYYDYNSPNGGDIYLDYNAEDGTAAKSVNIGSLNTVYKERKWVTETINLHDAKFVGSLSGCDFRIRCTQAGFCVREVTVVGGNDVGVNGYNSVEWTTNAEKGITMLGSGTIIDNFINIKNANHWLTFDVDDNYQYGADMNMAWVDISYLDSGTGEIYFEYNTSDPTATSAQRSHKRAEAITLTNTGEIKTKKIALIDVDFSGYSGYDFRVGTSNTAYIEKVKVLGY